MADPTPPIRSLRETPLRDVLERPAALRATVLLPVEGAFPRAQQNPVVQRHAVEALGKRLDAAGVDEAERETRCRALAAVPTDPRERERATCALAVLLDPDATWVQPLVVPVELDVRLGRHFRLREVLRSRARELPFRVLALSSNAVSLYAGDVHGLERVRLEGLPRSLVDALGTRVEGGHLDVRGGSSVPAERATRQGMHDTDQERRVDLERFHRVLSDALEAKLHDDTPIVLAADETQQSGFRRTARLPSLMEEGVEGTPDHWSTEDLHARAWRVVEAVLDAEERRAPELWNQARRRNKGVQRLADIASAAVQGRVHRLWIDAEAREPGTVDPERGDVIPASADDDVLDALAVLVLRTAGSVHPVPPGVLPSDQPALAELR